MSPEEVQTIYSPASMGRCAINPNSGFGHYPELMPEPKASRKVLIIGGGAAGLQAAITATKRGHRVTLMEKTDKLGGIINFTDIDSDKVDLRNFKNLLIKEASECGAKILMNTEASKEAIMAAKPDIILAAVGSKPLVPPIEGIDKAINALDVYNEIDEIGRKAIIVGGGLVGCEVGLYLASEGHEVTIVEMQKMMAYETFGYYRNALLDEMDKRGIHQILDTKCLAFTEAGIKALENGKERTLSADTYIFSMGMKANSDIVEKIKSFAGDIPVRAIGDCVAAGKVGDAVRAGYMAAMEII